MNERTKRKSIFYIAMCLVVFQSIMLIAKQIVFKYTVETLYSRSMVTMFCMILFFTIMVLFCRHNNYTFSAFPKVFKISYILITVVAVAFYVVTLFFVNEFSVENALMLFYGSFITPVFEELLFRGVIWNRLNKCFSKEWHTYLIVTLLFALWHIGYAIGIYLWNDGNLFNAIVMKALMGAFYGLIMGAVRYKAKNCYLGILVHGVLNAFG